LRYRVFVQEMGARPPQSTSMLNGREADHYDVFCDHLLVRVFTCDSDKIGTVVGTYRVLGPSAAACAGGFYTDTAFDLTPLTTLRARAVELGRSCVHPEWRSGAVIMALWTALGRYMSTHRLDTLIGCASISMHNQRHDAQRLWHRLRDEYLVAPEWQVRPLVPLPMEEVALNPRINVFAHRALDAPPLIKGYLRCGARVLGPPAFDAMFRSADLPIMLRVAELSPVYRRHFMGC
jgi:putative hemolysin